jgi:hypothetical protein
MTTPYQINLIRDRVMPARQRRALFAGLTVYLFACIALCLWLAYDASSRFAHSIGQRELGERVGRPGGLPCEGAADVEECAATLTARVDAAADRLNAIQGILQRRVDVVRCILALAGQLEPGMELMRFDLDTAARRLKFDIVVHSDPEAGKGGADKFAATLAADAWLGRQVRDVRPVGVQTERLEGEPVQVWRFEAAVAGRDQS